MENERFVQLVSIIRHLQGPQGCPWDKEQTLKSMRGPLVEETYEVVEAIDLEDNSLLEEELGDLFCQAVFLSLLAEKEGKGTLDAVLDHIIKKLIRRHPHIFSQEIELHSAEDVIHNWDKIKKEEHKHTRKSALDGIPKDLPSLARAQKMIKKMKGFSFHSSEKQSREEVFGKMLYDLVTQCDSERISADQALGKYLTEMDKAFRNQELQVIWCTKPIILEHIEHVKRLLSYSLYEADERKIEKALSVYLDETRYLLLAIKGSTPVGLLGVDNHGKIHHIAVDSDFRHQGIAKQLILTASDRFSEIEAETDREAVEFYRACGFAVESLGELYQGTERFKCTKCNVRAI